MIRLIGKRFKVCVCFSLLDNAPNYLVGCIIQKRVFFQFIIYLRGTYGGCFATTLGAMVHELGHTLDLGHTENGIMARGFDVMDRFFTICPQTATGMYSGSQFSFR